MRIPPWNVAIQVKYVHIVEYRELITAIETYRLSKR